MAIEGASFSENSFKNVIMQGVCFSLKWKLTNWLIIQLFQKFGYWKCSVSFDCAYISN